MKKIIEFFKNLFGRKWEYIPTDYVKQTSLTKQEKAEVKRISKSTIKALDEVVVKKPRKKSETKNKTLKKIETKKPVKNKKQTT
jgi:hypothetical protein